MRCIFLHLELFLLILVFCSSPLYSQSATPKKSNNNNIILILLDQWRYDAFSAYYKIIINNKKKKNNKINNNNNKQKYFHIHTPNINCIAMDGVLFEHAYSSTPSCTPARSAILTGQSPWKHGMLGYGPTVALKYPFELIQTLKHLAGYYTAMIGKNHFGWYKDNNNNNNMTHPISHGFQYYKLYDGGGTGMPPNNNNNNKYYYTTTNHGDNNNINIKNDKSCNNCSTIIPFGYDDYDQWFQTLYPNQSPLSNKKRGIIFGWNDWMAAPYDFPKRIHPTAWTTRHAMHFIQNYFSKHNQQQQQQQQHKPLFLKISYHRPHSPYDPPKKYLQRVLKRNIPLPISWDFNDNISNTATTRWDDKYKHNSAYCGPQRKDAWCGKMPINETIYTRAAYIANIEFIDYHIGKIISQLKSNDLYDNTMIILTSDHGDMQGDHYLWRKTYPYEGSTHIPMIIKWPKGHYHDNCYNLNKNDTTSDNQQTAKIISQVVELRDLFPTILNMTGHKIPENNNIITMEGKNIACLLSCLNDNTCNNNNNNNNCQWRKYIDLEHNKIFNVTNHWNALTDGHYKYIFHAHDGSEQLFDLKNDPYEKINLADSKNNNTSLLLFVESILLPLWRNRMVRQFEQEGRGIEWVQNGTLQIRKQGTTYGPNYPKQKEKKIKKEEY